MTALYRDGLGRLLGFALLGNAVARSATLAEDLPGPFGRA